MDIVEGLIALGSFAVDSMISTSGRYSKDKRFTPEGREYYTELNQALTMAKRNLQEYKEKRNTHEFKKLQIDENERLNLITNLGGTQVSMNSSKRIMAFNLIEAYFGGFRNCGFEDVERHLFHFIDHDCPISRELIRYVKNPRSGQSFDITPVLGIGITQNVWNGLTGQFKIKRHDFLVFCLEGIAFAGAKGSPEYTVIPYENIEKVYRDERHKDSFLLGRTQYQDLYLKPLGYTDEWDMLRIRFSPKLSEGSKKLIANSLFDFIRCFNPKCTFDEKRGSM